ncbi:sensor histidine kinase [Clostridium amazonitimonense]|uniref:sensor histidine kinase n=1 Tax=Clostridium amazonitimonense TaxID=1499689 RepID=UPI000509B511|nr:HAMP domain-containing sensor histidine kinase [Clostridium amazonitimonense]
MKSVPKLIKRFVGILLLSSFLILFFNFIAVAVIGYNQTSIGSPWTIAEETSKGLSQRDNGYTLSEEVNLNLKDLGIWAILIDNDTGKVIWNTDNLPEEIPLKYNISDIATLTRGYVKAYPTFTSDYNDNLIVLGFPKTSYWKHMYNSWDYNLIANFPKIALGVILGNILVIFLIYMIANTKLLKSVNPILKAIEELPNEKDVHIKEKGVLSEIATYINSTSDILQTKNSQLKKKETARANWIAGVSHDIRTPLSMVMGYAGQLEEAEHLSEDERQKASLIRKQSQRMKNLINDLNLASKLEYNMQPVNFEKVNAISLIRQVVVDFINSDIQDKYPIEWNTAENLICCNINCDASLIKRAVTNLIQNSQNHNLKGCEIFVEVKQVNHQCIIIIDDNGIGIDDEKLKKIKNTPHYMVCDNNVTHQQHGLGLLIVKQIVSSHNGSVEFNHSSFGGFSTVIILPLSE